MSTEIENKNSSSFPKKAVYKNLRILVIGAHPADVFDNAGGTCLHHARQGDEIYGAVITHGARIHDVVISDEMRKKKKIPQGVKLKKLMEERSEVKKEEVRKACKIMGIKDVHFINFDDEIMLVKEKYIRSLARLIRNIRPDIIITHYPYDNGGLADQHAITGQCVLNAAWVANTVDPGDPHPPHNVAQLYFFGIPTNFLNGGAFNTEFSHNCSIYIDITDVIHLKVKALDCMRSQQYDGRSALKRIETIEGSAGAAIKVPYAEPFIVAYPEVHYTLPVSNFRLLTANQTEAKMKDQFEYIHSVDGEFENYKKSRREKADAKAEDPPSWSLFKYDLNDNLRV
jgi:LmbE family N-acetylglucosaminyl deacetylase